MSRTDRQADEPSDFKSIVLQSDLPLVVDLDGTLTSGDMLEESIVSRLLQQPTSFLSMLQALRVGKAELKNTVAQRYVPHAPTLPYQDSVLKLIRSARDAGRPVFLATASHEQYAHAVSNHLGLFDGVFATTRERNLLGPEKASALVQAFGERGFDYVGNSEDDLHVWRHARRCYAVGVNRSVASSLREFSADHEHLEAPRLTWRVWVKALRVHQYAKNTLVFLPAIASHATQLGILLNSFLAFVAFSLAASAIYLLNDLVDIPDDRGHPTKMLRPLASGLMPMHTAVAAVPVLILACMGVAVLLPPAYWLVLAIYLVTTTAYSFYLKRKLLVDVIVLAMLYSIRVYAGSAATGILPSNWLLTFCLFAFTSLALIKRYTELLMRVDRGLPNASNRNYRKDDLPIIASLAAASGVNTVTVLALYISSPEIAVMYHRPQALWLLCPVLLFVLSRALMMAHRRLMHDDPVAWALKDKVCRIAMLVAAVDLIIGAIG